MDDDTKALIVKRLETCSPTAFDTETKYWEPNRIRIEIRHLVFEPQCPFSSTSRHPRGSLTPLNLCGIRYIYIYPRNHATVHTSCLFYPLSSRFEIVMVKSFSRNCVNCQWWLVAIVTFFTYPCSFCLKISWLLPVCLPCCKVSMLDMWPQWVWLTEIPPSTTNRSSW